MAAEFVVGCTVCDVVKNVAGKCIRTGFVKKLEGMHIINYHALAANCVALPAPYAYISI